MPVRALHCHLPSPDHRSSRPELCKKRLVFADLSICCAAFNRRRHRGGQTPQQALGTHWVSVQSLKKKSVSNYLGLLFKLSEILLGSDAVGTTIYLHQCPDSTSRTMNLGKNWPITGKASSEIL